MRARHWAQLARQRAAHERARADLTRLRIQRAASSNGDLLVQLEVAASHHLASAARSDAAAMLLQTSAARLERAAALVREGVYRP
ncbi:hypothetical protein BIV57_00745 [Mangrovactinospora gilvigrisea]|uniref:ANTAR domain-containing protein n=2 Tax=Mangrovactinospora gilvigrisea TaxID=1428644 RepID=A0A1J7CIE1_9ACTN|nr:hypothetical protein BIV57_00745 [Mangrovactinospora gilvigrisea]